MSVPHTPTPWFASTPMKDEWDYWYCTIGPFDSSDRPDQDHMEDTIAEVRGINHDAAANAQLIVKAVNAYAPLRDALRAWMEVQKESAEENPCPDYALRRRLRLHALELTRAALALVDGE